MKYFLPAVWICLTLACTQEPTYRYLALGHIYRWDDTNDRMDPRIDSLDISDYDGVWLLGDVTGRTSEDTARLAYVDRKFGLTSASTHWAIGNHDLINGSRERIEAFTGRRTAYAHPEIAPGLHLLILDTNLFAYPESSLKPERCARLEDQFEVTHEAVRQVPTGDRLIVLHHADLVPQHRVANTFPPLNHVWNFYHPEFWTDCTEGKTFTERYLPLFDAAAERGVQVSFIGGDIGQRWKRFEYRDSVGIQWLGTGINNSLDPAYAPDYVTNTTDPDEVLQLIYRPADRSLRAKFVRLNDLLPRE